MGFPRQEHYSRVGCHGILLQGIFQTQGLSLFLKSPALAGGFFTTKRHLGNPYIYILLCNYNIHLTQKSFSKYKVTYAQMYLLQYYLC